MGRSLADAVFRPSGRFGGIRVTMAGAMGLGPAPY